MQPTIERARSDARQAVIDRLTLMSAAIWTVGAFVAYAFVLVPMGARPSGGMIAGVLLLLPAAVPWIFYPRLVAAATRRADDALRAASGPSGDPSS